MGRRRAAAGRPIACRISNRNHEPLLVRIEPWAREVTLAAGATHDLVFTGPDPAFIEIESAPGVVTVYGWVDSVLDGNGLPVPPTPETG
jgi:hypothetical protein